MKVVAIKTIFNGEGQSILKGKIYSVLQSSECCKLFYDVGIRPLGNQNIFGCMECGYSHPKGVCWAQASFFIPISDYLKEQTESTVKKITKEIQIEVPETIEV